MNREELRKKLRKIISTNITPTQSITYDSYEDNIEEYLQAEVQKTPYGTCLVKYDYFPNGYKHGISDIHSFLNYQPCVISNLMNNSTNRRSPQKLSKNLKNYTYSQTEFSAKNFLKIPIDK